MSEKLVPEYSGVREAGVREAGIGGGGVRLGAGVRVRFKIKSRLKPGHQTHGCELWYV